MNNFVEFYSGQTYSPADVQEVGTLILRSSNINDGKIIDADNVYINSEKINSPNVQTGDIIVVVRNGSRSLLGKHAQILQESPKTVIGAFMTGIRSKSPSFVNALLDTTNFYRQISNNLGATINQITNYMFDRMNFIIPTISEQNKIGELISTLNKIITLEQEKHKKLICLFNQLYTNIFSERLRDLSKEYSKVKLSDIIFPHDERAEDNSYPLLSSTLSGIFLQSEYFDNNTASSDIYNYKVVPNGYFTYRSMSDTGKFKINLQNIVEKGIVSPAYPVFKLSDNVNKVYFEKYIEYCPETQYKISVAAQGGTRLALPFTKLQDIEIFLHTPEDQENISDLIKLIDKIILLSENKTLKLQLLKQFLLNNLFI